MVSEMATRLFPTPIVMIIMEVLLKVMREEQMQNKNAINAKSDMDVNDAEPSEKSDLYFSNPSKMVDKIMTFLAF